MNKRLIFVFVMLMGLGMGEVSVYSEPFGSLTTRPVEGAETNMTCHATHNNGATVFSSNHLGAVQDAVDAALPSATVKVAGTCTGIAPDSPTGHGVSINRLITLRGGYALGAWNISDPDNQPTTLDGAYMGRVINVFASGITIENLTVTRGISVDGGGIGALFSTLGVLTLRNLIVEENSATSTGGGISTSNIDLTLEDSLITNNHVNNNSGTSAYGGGLRASCLHPNCGSSQISDTTFTDNSARLSGGAAYFFIGDFRLENVMVLNNEVFSGGEGGGIYNSDATLALITSTVADNDAPSGFGGGLHNRFGIVTIDGTLFDSNHADAGEGGGIYNGRGMTILDSDFNDNSARDGGAVFGHGAEKLVISGTRFDNNEATQNGGALHNEGEALLYNVTVEDSTAALYGGGVYNNTTGLLLVDSTTIANNVVTGQFSGGGGIFNQGTLEMTNATVSGNSAASTSLGYTETHFTDEELALLLGTAGGGGLLNHNGDAKLVHVTIANNHADLIGDFPFGGGIRNSTSISQLELINVLAAENSGGDCAQYGILVGSVTSWIEDGGCNATFSGDPDLLPLGTYGGATRTHALAPSSQAIDAASATIPPTLVDQRGIGRPQGTAPDIGAFEWDGSTPTAVTLSSLDAQAHNSSLLWLFVVVTLISLGFGRRRKLNFSP